MPHHSWKEILERAYGQLDPEYRIFLEKDNTFFPTRENYLNAFRTLPKDEVKYVLFGQDPYPRRESAGGYAFIDEKVKTLFSDKGLSKEVNRATSLRNFIKMALLARGDITVDDTSQTAISRIDRTALIESICQLRINFEKNGVLLLNTSLIFTDKKSSSRHVKSWRPFMHSLLNDLRVNAPKLILFGTHAQALKKSLPLESFETIEVEHPYNHTFICNEKVLNLFRPMNLLEK
ncbi:uracil-DNA glycosylase [Sulfurovum sp. ST-21]|uniref:Uracil-DNA glycosylase n=2 Tax=Sulfurovum indicum TaxID=2779528 RepID=A0A7M1S693_9BACT|nr:uracil-DNA glycosylase [Sulfurovum indicum]